MGGALESAPSPAVAFKVLCGRQVCDALCNVKQPDKVPAACSLTATFSLESQDGLWAELRLKESHKRASREE